MMEKELRSGRTEQVLKKEMNRGGGGPPILGLTGGVGAGKSSVLAVLAEEYGFYRIETDRVARRLLEPGGASYRAVCRLLGEGILTKDGRIDRPAMARLIFHDDALRRRVDALVHPLVWQAAFEEAACSVSAGKPAVVESAVTAKEFRDNCREIWYVYTSKEERVRRLMENRGYSRERARAMIASQPSEEAYRAFADAWIDNGGAFGNMHAQVAALMARRPDWGRTEQQRNEAST